VWDWGAKIVDKKVFRAGKPNGSVFDEPVYLVRAEWEEEVVPYSSEDVMRMLGAARNHLTKTDFRFSSVENKYSLSAHDNVRVDCAEMLKDIDRCFDDVQQRALKSMPKFKTVEEATEATEPNPIKNSEVRRRWLKSQLPGLMPGAVVSFSGREDQGEKGMVVSIFPPEKRTEAHLLGQYTARLVVPGSDKLNEFTFNQFIGDPLFGREHLLGNDYTNPLKAFDIAKPGRITFSRNVLMGNMFSASQFVAEHRLGSAAIFTDETGARHRAVVLYARVTQADVMDMPVALNRTLISTVLEKAYTEGQSVRLVASATLSDKQCQIIFDRNRASSLTIATSGTKSMGGVVFTNKDLIGITGDFAGNRTNMSATVDFSKMEVVVDALLNRCGQSFYIDAQTARRLLPELAGGDVQDDEESDQHDISTSTQPRPRFAA
jgi:hypothetical protein